MGLLQTFKMMLDPASKQKFEADMKDAGKKGGESVSTGVETGTSRLGSVFTRLGGIIAATFAIHKLIEFGKASIDAANESDIGWQRIGTTLRNNGSSLDAMRGRLEALGETFLRTTRFGDEAAIESANTYIQLTGDVVGVERAVAASANLAAARHLDLEQATTLVARAVNGNTTALKKMGIEIPKGGDAVAVLAAKFKGVAAGELTTFAGKTQQMGMYMDELREAIGHAMIAAGEGSSIMDTFSGIIAGATKWVIENRDMLQSLGTVLLNVVAGAFRVVGVLLTSFVAGIQQLGKIFAPVITQVIQSFQNLIEVGAKAADFLGFKDTAAKMRAFSAEIGTSMTRVTNFMKGKNSELTLSHEKQGAALGSAIEGGGARGTVAMQKLAAAAAVAAEKFRLEVQKFVDDMPKMAEAAAKDFLNVSTGMMQDVTTMVAQAYWDQYAALRDSLANSAVLYQNFSEKVIITEDMTQEQRRRAFEDSAQAGEDAAAREAMAILKGDDWKLSSTEETERSRRYAIVQSGMTEQATSEETAAKIQKDNEKKKASYDHIVRVVSDITSAVSGVIDTLGLGGTAVGKLATGFINLAGKATNFVAAIASGNWISALTQGLGLLGSIAGAFGSILKTIFGGFGQDPVKGKVKQLFTAGDEKGLEAMVQDPSLTAEQRQFALNALKRLRAGESWAGGGVTNPGSNPQPKPGSGTPAPTGGSPWSPPGAPTPVTGGGGAVSPWSIGGAGISPTMAMASTRGSTPQVGIIINQTGVSGTNVTQKTVSAIDEALASSYQKAATLSGNAGM